MNENMENKIPLQKAKSENVCQELCNHSTINKFGVNSHERIVIKRQSKSFICAKLHILKIQKNMYM